LKNIPITLLGMALLVFVNDFVTTSLSKDNVKPTKNPNKWQLRDITIASLVVGAFFVLEDILVMFLGLKYFNFTFENLQTFLLLNLVFNSQLRVLIV
jgi:H+-transporting ATPase